jgi:hypothetical protein
MLDSISWREFFVSGLLMIVAYYIVTLLSFYRHEIVRLLKRQPVQKEDSSQYPSPMGKAKFAQPNSSSTESFSSEDITVAPINDAEPLRTDNSTLIHEDLLTEIKTVIHADITEEELDDLFPTLLSRYPEVIGTPSQDKITVFIYNTLRTNTTVRFSISHIHAWWPAQESENPKTNKQ